MQSTLSVSRQQAGVLHDWMEASHTVDDELSHEMWLAGMADGPYVNVSRDAVVEALNCYECMAMPDKQDERVFQQINRRV